jgi:hypothetical protein
MITGQNYWFAVACLMVVICLIAMAVSVFVR